MIKLSLGIGAKIKWRDLCSLSMKEGRIVRKYSNYSRVEYDRSDYCYDVIESNTDTYYKVGEQDIIYVYIDGEWRPYKSSLSIDIKAVARNAAWGSYESSLSSDAVCQRCIKAARGYIYSFKPKKVIFNGPATIVMWPDGTKTIVKRREGEEDDREKAVMYCILKKLCGGKASMDRYLKLFLKEKSNDEEKEES